MLILTQEIRIRKSPLYIIGGILFLFIFILIDTNKIKQKGSLVAAGGLLLFLVIYYLLSKLKLLIDQDGITQQLIFGKKRKIKWSEIKSSSLNWHFHGHGANLSWEITSFSGKPISLQTSFYSRKIFSLLQKYWWHNLPMQ